MEVNYCSSLKTITFDPFRPYEADYARLGYLKLLLKPYISVTDPSEGILSEWQFSEDGKTLTAKVSDTARWLDGSQVSSRDVALSLAKGLDYRHLGKKVRVKGFDGNKEGWESRECPGIQLHDERSFAIQFETGIDLPAEEMIEAFSDKTNYNFTWPKRLDIDPEAFDVVALYPMEKRDGHYYAKAFDHTLKVSPVVDSDPSTPSIFFIHGVAEEHVHAYHQEESTVNIIGNGTVNLNKDIWQNRTNREKLASLFRYASAEATHQRTIYADRFILKNEPGFAEDIEPWSDALPTDFPCDHIKILAGFKISTGKDKGPFIKSLEGIAAKIGVKITWQDIVYNDRDLEADVILSGGTVVDGRQTWLQDFDKNDLFTRFVHKDTELVELFGKLSEASAVTKADDHGIALLSQFDMIARKNVSMFPIRRSKEIIYSNKDLNFYVGFNSSRAPRLFRKKT